MYESLATQGREKVHTGLAGIDSSRLKKLRSSHLRDCFNLIDEMRHKLEFVARVRGISFIDDAASRSSLSTWYALETVEGAIVWIANGASLDRANASGIKRLRTLVKSKVKTIICLGDCTAFEMTFGDIVSEILSASDMHEAVTMAFYRDYEDYKVLFSPAVENGQPYEEQGDAFKREVNEL